MTRDERLDEQYAGDERYECAECGHEHWDPETRTYSVCPLRAEGCDCNGQR